MSQRVLILVEGQTEERCVKDLLAPVLLHECELYVVPTLLTTKRVKDGPHFKGGVTSFGKYEMDVRRLLQGAGDGALVTTMIDYYALPNDFPGMSTRPAPSTRRRVLHVEQALHTHFGAPANFLPFLMRHEFEALLFSDKNTPPNVPIPSAQNLNAFAAVCDAYDTPEDINESPAGAPSKRLGAIFPGYRKLLHGPACANRIGLDRMCKRCPHFAEWLANLRAFSEND